MTEIQSQLEGLRRTLWCCSVALGAAVLLLGLMVIVGWFTGNRTLVQVVPGFVPMQFNTALAFVFCGASLLLLSYGREPGAAVAGALVALTGMLTLVEYVADVSLGIDELFMKHDITTATSHPGRMAPNTAVCFTLVGLLAVLPVRRWSARHRSMARIVFTSLTLGLAVVALAGYFTRLETAYGWGNLTRMAVHTSVGFVAVSVGILCFVWQTDLRRDHWVPHWMPLVAAVAIVTATLCLWQAVRAEGARIHALYPDLSSLSRLSLFVLIAGTSLALAMALVAYLAQQAGHRAREIARTNRALQDEIATRHEAEKALQKHRDSLEETVAERTRELVRAQHEAEEANRAKSEFLSHMSHELRTPLNGILGYAQILQRDPSIHDSQRGSLEAIVNCGDHLLSLINDVLDLSKIEAGRIDVDRAPLDLHRLIHSVGDVVQTRASGKGIALTVDLAPNLPQGIVSDAAKLRQILVNLLGNAVKFTEKGSVAVSAEIAPQGFLRIAVEDTGVGISPEEIEDIFDPFKQVEAGKAAGGTGLGLAITKRLIEALSGELTVTSEVRKGSTFVVVLPLVEASDQELLALPEEGGLSGERLVLAAGCDCTILVADDRETNRDVLNGMLAGVGFKTLLASDGDDALEMLRRHPEISLVLMDLKMPRVSGMEALQQIRQDEKLQAVKVIAVTASTLPGFRQQGLDAGFDDFLSKPFRVAKLLEKLKHHLNIEMQPSPITERSSPESSDTSQGDITGMVSDGIRTRLRQALSIKNLTAIKTVADELASDPTTAALGEHIHTLRRAFDFQRLDELVQEMEQQDG